MYRPRYLSFIHTSQRFQAAAHTGQRRPQVMGYGIGDTFRPESMIP